MLAVLSLPDVFNLYHVKLISVLLFLFNSLSVCAQEDSIRINKVENEIRFILGPHTGYFKDLNYSVLNYRQRGTCYDLGYTHENKMKRYLLKAGISFTSGKLRTAAADHFTTPFIQGQLSFGMLFRVRPKSNSRFSMYAGPQLSSFFQYMQWGDEMDSWSYLMAHGLNISVYETFQLTTRKKLSAFFTMPILSNFVRPPYNGFNENIIQNQEKILKLSFDGEPATLNKYVSIDVHVVYLYSFGEHVDFTVAYMLRYQHTSGYNELTQLQNQFTSGLNIRF